MVLLSVSSTLFRLRNILCFFIFLNCFHEVIATSYPMSYEDIVTFARPQWTVISFSGSQIAFTVRKASLEDNSNKDTLYRFDRTQNRQIQILESKEVLQAIWSKTNALYFLVRGDNKYKILRLVKDEITPLLDSDDPISLFTLSSDESSLYYTVGKMNLNHQIEEGYVYDWKRNNVHTIVQRQYRKKEWEEIWKLDLTSQESSLVTRISYDNWLEHLGCVIENFHVSEDGKYLLLCIQQIGKPDIGQTGFITDVVTWDIQHQEWYNPLNQSIESKQIPCWLDEQRFVFQQSSNSSKNSSIWLFDAKTRSGYLLDWIIISEGIDKFHWDSTNKLLYAITQDSLYRIFLEEKKVEKIPHPPFLSQIPSMDQQAHCLGFIDESSNVPPEIAIYDLKEKQVIRLTTLNPQLARLALGEVEEIKITTKSGISSTGFLVHPIKEEPGKRYPIIIATYGFSGHFITDAEWHSSFPAQKLAGEGYLTLLLNCPGMAQHVLGNSEKAREIEGWNTLELFECAVELLNERGIGDPTKVGIYGWSHGAFIVNFLISHSQKFHVACSGEGGDYNPGSFWSIGNKMYAKVYDNIFGGPPWGSTLKNYLSFSPFFHMDKIRAPLLLEYGESAVLGLEMHIPLRYLGVPTELIIYEEEHHFVKPRARMASMARKVDWFNFWFFNKCDPDPNKKAQYLRWNTMREEASKRNIL